MYTEPQTAAAKPAVSEAAPTRKFMFERSFDGAPGTRAPERKPVTLKPEQYDALKKEAYDAGFAAGHQAGLDEQTERFKATIEQVGAKIEHMLNNLHTIQKECQEGMRRMAVSIARKFVPDLTARNGIQEIEAMLADIMGEMVHEPRLVVRIHETQFDVLNEKINDLSTRKAYAGKVVVLADADIAPGDCRVEWADGGMERNSQTMWNKVEHVVMPQSGG